MFTTETIIKKMQSTDLYGSLVRNNARNKEFYYAISKPTPLTSHNGRAMRLGSEMFIALDINLDSQTGEIKWSYDSEHSARNAGRSGHHAQLVALLGVANDE